MSPPLFFVGQPFWLDLGQKKNFAGPREQKDWERRFADLKEQALTKLLLCAMGCTRLLRTSPPPRRS